MKNMNKTFESSVSPIFKISDLFEQPSMLFRRPVALTSDPWLAK